MKIFGYFLFCFWLVYGPKYGVIDFSILIPVILFPMIFRLNWKFAKRFTGFVIFLSFLIVYQVLIQILNSNFEFESVARLIRSLLVVIILGLVFGNDDKGLSKDICIALLYAIILHSILILLGSFFPFANEFFENISGNDRTVDYRSSGMLAGFDIAGFLAIIGLMMISFNVVRIKSKMMEGVFMLIIFSSSYFSSRVSVVIAIAVFLYYLLSVIRNSSASIGLRIFLTFVSSCVFIYVAYEALVVLEVTMSLGVIDVPMDVASSVVQRSAVQDSDKFLWEDMFYLPVSWFDTIFGTGGSTLDSDVGYIQEVFRYGFLGLSISLGAHFLFLYENFHFLRAEVYAKNHKNLIVMIFLLMLFLTLKNNYIFVRAIFPAFLIISASMVHSSR